MAIKKPVSFAETERDKRIYDYVLTKFGFSAYVKELIEKDMQQNQKTHTAKKENKGLNFDF